MALDKLINKLNRFKSTLDVNLVVSQAFQNGEVRAYTVDLIRFNQLYEGFSGDGRELESIGGGYTEYTKQIKRSLNLPTDKVTLFDTGDFYDSIFAITPNIGDGVIEIEADFLKDGQDLRSRWGNNLTELTPDSMSKLRVFLAPFLSDIIRNNWIKS